MADINIQEINDKLIRIEALLEGMKGLDELKARNIELEINILKEKIKVANNRIDDLEKNQNWTIKAIIGSVITAIGGFIYISK